jgi:hypothetical protein
MHDESAAVRPMALSPADPAPRSSMPGLRDRTIGVERGAYRVNLRHGVSRVRSGHRHAAGIIFHHAQ